MLQDWLNSYKPTDLFDFDSPNVIRDAVTQIIPESDDLKLGLIKETWSAYKPLDLPDDWKEFATKKNEQISPMKAIAIYFEEVIKRNPKR